MAVLPTFEPEGTPGEVGQVAQQTMAQQQSLMERAAQTQQLEQQTELQRQQFEVMRPVLQAKAAADIATAGATLANAKLVQDTRARMAQMAPLAQQEFEQTAAMSYGPETPPQLDEDGNVIKPGTPGERDWSGLYDAYQQLRAKYNWMGLVPEGQSFLHTIDEATADAHTHAITDATLKNQQLIAQETTDRMLGAAQIRATGMENVGAMRLQGVQETAAARSADVQTREAGWAKREQIRADLAAGKPGAILDDLHQREADATQEAQDALARGDHDAAQIALNHAQEYRDAAVKASTFSGGNIPTKPPSLKGVTPRPRPTAATNVPMAPVDFLNPGATPAEPTAVPANAPELQRPMEFANLAEAQQQAGLGQLQSGQRVVIGGVPGTWK